MKERELDAGVAYGYREIRDQTSTPRYCRHYVVFLTLLQRTNQQIGS